MELQRDYEDKRKQLTTINQEMSRTLQHELKNSQIETEQKLKQFKLKACDEVVKEFNMRTINLEEYRNLQESITRVTRKLDDLKKKFEANCATNRAEEKAKFEAELKRQNVAQEQAYKTATAEMKAQFNQQNKLHKLEQNHKLRKNLVRIKEYSTIK